MKSNTMYQKLKIVNDNIYLKNKNNKGITLIALIITIIVLLILAGITITALFGDNGLIERSQIAKLETRAGAVEDEVAVWKQNKTLAKYGGEFVLTSNELIDDQKERGILTPEEATIAKETGKVKIGSKIIEYRKENATISFTSSEVTIIKGKNGTLEPIIEPATENIELRWNSSNTSIATVQNGKISAISNGQTTISCEIVDQENSKIECTVNVSDGSEIYAVGKNDEYLDFKNMPNNAKLQVWEHYIGLQPTDHTYVNNTPTYTVPGNNVKTGAYTDMYYRLEDSYGNYSKYYYFYVDQLCFTKDTKVATPNGKKNIQDIKAGDLVYTMNLEKNQLEEKKVLQTFANVVDYKTAKIYIGNEYIECTTGHEIYTLNKGWTKAAYLETGDILLSRSQEKEIIINVELINKKEKLNVYNFEVEDNHNYFVGEKEYLVHNPSEVTCSIDGNTYIGTALDI